MTEDRLLEVLEEALSARVIEELPRTVGHYQFTQALIQETLLGELRATSRVRLHAQIATGLEALYGEDAEAYAGELAQHFTEAQTILGMAKVVKYSLLAGEQALSRYAHEEAVSHFRQGLAAKQGQPMDEETAGLLFGLTRGLSGRRDAEALEEAVRSLRTAFDYYVEIGDVSRAVSVTEVPLFNTNIEPLGLAEVYTRALSLVPPDSHEAGSILANYSYFLWLEKADFPSARQAALDAIAIAQRGERPRIGIAHRRQCCGFGNPRPAVQ